MRRDLNDDQDFGDDYEAAFCHTNVQGNVVAISDEDGTVRETFAYDIYGRLTAAAAWNGNNSAAVDEVEGFVDMSDDWFSKKDKTGRIRRIRSAFDNALLIA